ncbi:MAG: galactokinase [Candidatus Limnocylindrales bacterium]|jgi:galactokinase
MALKALGRLRIANLTAALEAEYGPETGPAGDSSPVEIVRAPGTVNLIGDKTDFNEGFVLSAAIELETWIAFRRRRDGRVRVASRASREPGSFWIDDLTPAPERRATGRAAGAATGRAPGPARTWSDYVAATAWSLREAALAIRGFDGFVDTTIPTGSGFSPAAALELASAVALLGGGVTTAPELAALAQRAERDYLGLNSGIVEQFTSAAGREGKALSLDCRSLDARYLPLPFGIRLVICDTGSDGKASRAAYEARRAECARAVALLAERIPGLCSMRDLDAAALRRHRAVLPERTARRVEHVISENGRVVATAAALEAGDLDDLGRIFAESHASLRDRYEISTPALDAMVEVAAATPGVVAARMSGDGLGSCTVNLVLADAVPALEAAVSREYGRRTGLTGQVYPVAIVNGAGPVNLAAG